MTHASLIGILILFQIKSYKIEEAEIKTVGLAPIWRGMWPCFEPQLLWWGLQQKSHGPVTVASHSMSRSESGGEGYSQQESAAIVSSPWASVRFVTQFDRGIGWWLQAHLSVIARLGELRLSLDSAQKNRQTTWLTFFDFFLQSPRWKDLALLKTSLFLSGA